MPKNKSNRGWQRLTPDRVLLPSADDVHLWFVSLDDPPLPRQHLESVLSVDERARADRFYFERDRRRFVAGRGLLRTILAPYQDTAPISLIFDYGPAGKPLLVDNSPDSVIDFNLSHSGGYALFAFSPKGPLGVDLELVRDLSDLERLSRLVFSEREQDELHSVPESHKIEAFFHGWTRKEALLKAWGLGIGGPLKQMEVTLHPDYPARVLQVPAEQGDSAGWSLVSLTPAPGFRGALALEGSGRSVQQFRWD